MGASELANRSQRALLLPFQERMDRHLQQYMSERMSTGDLSEACQHALRGGKRFRPALVYLIGQAMGSSVDPTPAALAVEFFHTASLVADDLPCMDNDDERRGSPAVHVVYGESTALLVTYALISEGYYCLAHKTAQVSDEARLAAIENASYNTGLHGATGGQYLDLFPPDINRETLVEVIVKKTVSLFEVAFVLGWLYSGGSVNRLPEVKAAAYHFGMAFQIADDFEDEVQDTAHACRVNFVLACGKQEALERFHQEIQAYREMLKRLDLNSQSLQLLAEVLESQFK